jgi:hypothetical protein
VQAEARLMGVAHGANARDGICEFYGTKLLQQAGAAVALARPAFRFASY